MKVAIVTDSLVRPGGADRVVQALLEIYPDADIFTAVFDKNYYVRNCVLKNIDAERVYTSFIQKLPFSRFFHRHYMPLSPLGFERLPLNKDYDVVISCSAGCAKGVITLPQTFHLGIIFTPPRYQWGGSINCRGNSLRSVLHFFSTIFDHYLRIWDIEASKRPDELIAISSFIKDRVQKVYKRSAKVVYPGVDTDFYFQDKGVKREDFYLIVSRLYDYKRFDLAINVCKKLGRKLIIIGDGPDRKYLENLSEGNPSIVFKGYLEDEVTRDYMRRCKAFVFPAVEDFGLVPVEAMCCGAPVIALGKGGVAETVEDGVSGILFKDQTEQSLEKAILDFEQKEFDCDIIEQRGRSFSKNRFKKEIESIINERLRKT